MNGREGGEEAARNRHGRDDHDAVRFHPKRVDVIHPVVDLSQGIVRITGTRPMTECRRRREAGFAGVDLTAIFGCETSEVENGDTHAGLLLQFLSRGFHHAVAFRQFAGTGMLTAGGTID